MSYLLSLAIVLLAADPQPISVAVPDRKEPVSYAKEVADILDAKCVGCHNGGLAESKLILEDVPSMLKGGKRGPAIVPGKADESLLFKLAAHRADPAMPPTEKKENEPLTSQELGLLKLWIDAGAKDDSAELAAEAAPVELGTLPPGVHPIVAVDMTADGKRVAAGRANLVQVYDADSGLEIVSLAGHQDIIQSLRFSADGSKLAAGSYQIVTLWNCPTGGESHTFNGHGDKVEAVAVAPDGKSIVSGGLDKTIRLWNPADGKELRKIDHPASQVLALAVSLDGKTVAAGGSDGIIRLFKLADGAPSAELKGHSGPVRGLTFLANGRLASASADGTARIWTLPDAPDAEPAEPVVAKGHEGALNAIVATPDGRQILTAGDDQTIRIWNADDGALERTLSGHEGPVLSLAIHPNGETLLSGSADKTARLWNLADGALIRTLPAHPSPVASVAFSPGGQRIVTAGADGGLMVRETGSGRAVLAFGHTGAKNQPLAPVRAVAFLDDGTFVSASEDKTLKSWTFQGSWSAWKTLGPHVDRVLALDFNPDGTLLAAGGGEPSRSGEVKIWETGKGLLVRTLDGLHSDTVFGVRFSPDGSTLATCAADKFLKVINVADGKELRSFEGHTHHVLAVDWSTDGKQLVTAGADNVLKFWDYEAGEQLRTTNALDKQVTAVRWAHGPGTPVIASASGDQTVRFWNPGNGQVVRTFSGPQDYVFSVALSADRSRVAAGGADGILFLWNGENGQVLRKLEPQTDGPPQGVAASR